MGSVKTVMPAGGPLGGSVGQACLTLSLGSGLDLRAPTSRPPSVPPHPHQCGVGLKSLVLSLGSSCSCCFSKRNKCSVGRERWWLVDEHGEHYAERNGELGRVEGVRVGEGRRQGQLGARTQRGDPCHPERWRNSTHPCRGAEPPQTHKTRGFMAHESNLDKAVHNCLAELQLNWL